MAPWLLGLAGAALLAFAWWGLQRDAAPPPPPTAPLWGDAALSLGPVEAYARGVALVDSGRSRASLPYLHHAVAAPGAPWQAWRIYASALHNAAMAGVTDPLVATDLAPRSSFERVALMREAFPRIDRAIALAGNPPERAIAQNTRGQFLRTWGFQWDAMQDFHMAGELDPSWHDQALFFARLMRDPRTTLE